MFEAFGTVFGALLGIFVFIVCVVIAIVVVFGGIALIAFYFSNQNERREAAKRAKSARPRT